MLSQVPNLGSDQFDVIALIDEMRENLGYVIRTPPRWYGLLRRNLHARNIRASNTIEGHNVTLDDAIAAVESEDPLDAKDEDWSAVVGYQQAMTYVLQLAKRPRFKYSVETLCSLHFMMMHFDLSKHPGNLRPGPVSVYDSERGELVYEGPDAELVQGLMQGLVDELNGEDRPPPLVRAAMAHLNLVMIHPFSDGNGRMGRCLQSLVLARQFSNIDPNFVSIESYLGRNTRDYYDALAIVGQGGWNPENDAGPWIDFCLRAHYRQAASLARRMRTYHKLWDTLETEVRRRALPERSVLALLDAAMKLKVRNATYRKAANLSPQIASRDLTALVHAGLLTMNGRARGAYYSASEHTLALTKKCWEPKKIDDPFELVKHSVKGQGALFGG